MTFILTNFASYFCYCPIPFDIIPNQPQYFRENNSYSVIKVSAKMILILTNFTDKWSPALQIRTVLLSIQALLSAPNPDDPLANDVAELWKVNEAEAIRNAKDWTRQYAMGN